MKQFLLLVALTPLISLAQDVSDDAFKPVGGEKTIELQLAPLGNSPVTINGIRVRKFTSENKAKRLNIFIGLDSDTFITQQENSDFDQEELKASTTEFTISVRPGFEKHVNVSKKLSPYFGMEFDLTYRIYTEKREIENGSSVDYIKLINGTDIIGANRSGFIRLGANAIAGMDYYIAKKLYLGTELGFGFSYTRFSDFKVKSDQSGFVEPDPEKQGRSFDVGPNVIAQIRFGYAF